MQGALAISRVVYYSQTVLIKPNRSREREVWCCILMSLLHWRMMFSLLLLLLFKIFQSPEKN